MLKKKAKQLRAHTEWSWDPNPRSVHLRSPLQRASSPTPRILKGEPSRAVQLARVCVGGGVLKGSLETSSEASLEHPCLALQLRSQADVIPSIHRNVLPHTHPRCQPASPLQLSTDLHENRRGSTDGPFSSQRPDREHVHPERYTAPRRVILGVRAPQLGP